MTNKIIAVMQFLPLVALVFVFGRHSLLWIDRKRSEARRRFEEKMRALDATPVRRILVRPSGHAPWCICDDWDGVGQMIEEDGDYEFLFVDMTEAEIEAKGEFPGW